MRIYSLLNWYYHNLYFDSNQSYIWIFNIDLIYCLSFIIAAYFKMLLETLSEIATKTSKSYQQYTATTICIIADISRQLHRKKENNYITQLKIMDQSINNKMTYGIMCKNCSLYVISNIRQKMGKIGDIVLLRKFKFYMWNGVKLETKYTGAIEVLQIYRQEDLVLWSQIGNIGSQSSMKLTNLELQKMRQLRNWFQNNINQYFQPQLGLLPTSTHSMMIVPFNMILKIKKIDTNYIELIDQNQNIYYVKMQMLYDMLPTKLQVDVNVATSLGYAEGDLLLIRQIKSIINKQLIFTETGILNKIPSIVDPSVMNYISIFSEEDKQKTHLHIKINNNLTQLSKNDITFKYLQELSELQVKYDTSSKKDEIPMQSYYRVDVIVIGSYGSFKLYHNEYQMIVHDKFLDDFSFEQQRKTIENHMLWYAFQGNLAVIDRSFENIGKNFSIELFSNDIRGCFYPNQIQNQLNQCIGQDNQNLLKKKNQAKVLYLLKILAEKTTFVKPASLILQVIRSDRLIFRLVDTLILNQ